MRKQNRLLPTGAVLLVLFCAGYAMAPRESYSVENAEVLPEMNYTGSLRKERFTGEGRLEFFLESQKATYEGTFSEGLPEGQGKLTLPGAVLEGTWKEGELQKGARITLPDKGVYQQNAEGDWQEGKK